jgi:hypothetical protein
MRPFTGNHIRNQLIKENSMNKFKFTVIASAVAFAFSGAAFAATMTKDDYNKAKATIATDYKAAGAACDSFAANAKDICKAEAKGKENVSKAELEEGYKPSNKAHYNVSVAKADALYAVAIEKCDDKAGNDKDVCVKEAKAARISAKADATAALKTVNANDAATKKSNAAQAKASEAKTVARKDAATDKRDAEYAVAKEKCDTFAADAKTNCIKEAKARYGQS